MEQFSMPKALMINLRVYLQNCKFSLDIYMKMHRDEKTQGFLRMILVIELFPSVKFYLNKFLNANNITQIWNKMKLKEIEYLKTFSSSFILFNYSDTLMKA